MSRASSRPQNDKAQPGSRPCTCEAICAAMDWLLSGVGTLHQPASSASSTAAANHGQAAPPTLPRPIPQLQVTIVFQSLPLFVLQQGCKEGHTHTHLALLHLRHNPQQCVATVLSIAGGSHLPVWWLWVPTTHVWLCLDERRQPAYILLPTANRQCTQGPLKVRQQALERPYMHALIKQLSTHYRCHDVAVALCANCPALQCCEHVCPGLS